jgi:aerobic carbon-monoxide dehydrogenase large subunit
MNAPEQGFAAGRFGSGQHVRRIEDPALVRGLGQFTDDVAPAGEVFMHFVRSPVAHGRVIRVDTGAALAMPGVLAVYTGADLQAAGIKPLPPAAGFKRGDGQAMSPPPRRALATDFVRYVGEPVAAVVAHSRDAARAAADAVVVDIDALPAVASSAAALLPDAVQVWPGAPGNVLAEARHGDASATAAAFAGAAHHVRLQLINQRVAPATMEPRVVLAWMDQDRLTVRLSSQMPTGVRSGLVATLPAQTEASVRVLVGDVGGGFGMKTALYAEDVVVAFAATQLRRPVKWQAQRLEEFLSAVHGRDVQSQAELALDAQGKVLALRVSSVTNVGACPTGAGVAIQLLIGPWVSTSIYDITCIDLHIRAVLTHTAATGAYRGAGRPEAIYIIERLFDAAAREMKIDPAELRRRNMIQPTQMPYRNAMGQVYDSGQFERVLDQGLQLADWPGFAQRRDQSKARGLLRGRGIATFLEWTGGNALEENVQVRIVGDATADGFVELTSATMAMGQGIATSYAQLAVDVLGVPIERIRVLQGDTDRANGFGSAGSRSLFTGGAAVRVAAQRTVDLGKDLAAKALEAAAGDIEYVAGRYTVAGTDVSIGLFELAQAQPEQMLWAEGSAKASAATWPNACHICEVEIDPATGETKVVAYASVNDIGRIVSPTLVRGQVDGGAMQGIGQALCEQVVYDEGGQLLSASFMDYALPNIDMFHNFNTVFDERVPCLTNTLGSKGVGELGTIGATPAVVNAVIDALDHAGLGREAERVQMPLTAPVVWRALQR